MARKMDFEKESKRRQMQKQGIEPCASKGGKPPWSEEEVGKRNYGKLEREAKGVRKDVKSGTIVRTPEKPRRQASAGELSKIQRRLNRSLNAKKNWERKKQNALDKIEALKSEVTSYSRKIEAENGKVIFNLDDENITRILRS